MTVLKNTFGGPPWSVCGNLDSFQSSVSQLPSQAGRTLPYLLWSGTCRWTRYDVHGGSCIKEGFYYNSTTWYLFSAFINRYQDIWLTIAPYHVLILNHKVIASSPQASSTPIFGFPVVAWISCRYLDWQFRFMVIRMIFSKHFQQSHHYNISNSNTLIKSF